MSFGPVVSRILPLAFLTLPLVGCSGSDSTSGTPVLTAELPLHLEEHFEAATLVGSEVPAEVPTAVEWRFDEPQPDWRLVRPWRQEIEPARVTYVDDAMQLTLTEANTFVRWWDDRSVLVGGIYVAVPDWNLEDWAYVLVRARASEGVEEFGLGFNLKEGFATARDGPFPYRFFR